MVSMSVCATRRTLAWFAFIVGIAWPAVSDAQAGPNDTYGKLPLHFEANQGQTHKDVRFLARGPGYGLYLTGTEAVLVLSTAAPEKTPNGRSDQRTVPTQKSVALRMNLVGAAPAPLVSGLEELPGKANYFIGKDSSQWRTNVPTYAKVHYREVYPGIDLVYYGNQRQLEYDFVVAPGADPNKIVLAFKGAKRLEIDAKGDLVLHAAGGVIRQHRPVIYQDVDGVRQEIAGHYVRRGASRVGFKVAPYDRSRPLVIDPVVLSYSTYLGGASIDAGYGIAVDADGNAYVTGFTQSANFPITAGSFQTTYAGAGNLPWDVFVTKINPTGSALIYSTFLGGGSTPLGSGGRDWGIAIAVDTARNAYVTGYTDSPSFPTTPGAFQPNATTGSDAFVTKLNPNGSGLVYSTYLEGRGNDEGRGIAVDSAGSAYVTGVTTSSDFPTTPGALRASSAGVFVTKFNAAGTGLVYSALLGDGEGNAIAIDAGGNAYITGKTSSLNFPTTAGAVQPTFNGGSSDAFASKLNPTGTALIYSTYLGGAGDDTGTGVAVNTTGNAYITGSSTSTNLPTTTGSFRPATAGGEDAFVTKLGSSGTAFVYFTYLGGGGRDVGNAIALDMAGNAYVTGMTNSLNFPVSAGTFQASIGGDYDAFVAKFSPSGAALIYSTYVGGSSLETGLGIAVNSAGDVYVTGLTVSTNFPTTPGALQSASAGPYDVFVMKIVDSGSPPQPSRLEEEAATFAGNWPTYGAEIGTFSNGRIAASNQVNATATFRFTGSSVAWIGAKCNACGIATVSIDGGTPVSVNTFGPAGIGSVVSESVFSASGLAPGVVHTLTITVTGTSTPGSVGTYIAVDAFDVTPMRLEQSAAAFAGSWPSYGSDAGAFSGGNVVASNQPAATATFSFTGTAVSWLGARCNVCGIASVSINGGAPVNVNTFGPGSPGGLAWDSVFYASGLAPGTTHTLRISVTGAADPASGGSYIAVDGFDVTR